MSLIVNPNFFRLPGFPRLPASQPVNPLIVRVAVQAILIISFLFFFKKLTFHWHEINRKMQSIRMRIALAQIAQIELQNINDAAHYALQQFLQPNQPKKRPPA